MKIMLGVNKWLDAHVYMQEQIEAAGLTVTAAGEILPSSQWANPDQFFSQLMVNYQTAFTILRGEWKESYKKAPFPYEKYPEAILIKAFANCVDEMREAARTKILESLVAPPTDPSIDYMAAWIAATIKDAKPEDVAVYKHFIWQVKRKLAGLPVEYHMMINVLGNQGAGKSKSTRRLLEPLQALAVERRLSDLTDERNTYLYGRVAVILIEELAGAGKADIETLKANMTKKVMQSRRLGHNAHSNNFQNTTLISTSNQSIAEAISDSSGMRRFYEVTFRTDGQACWDAQAAINPLDVWRSVDHLREVPYIAEYEEAIKERQQTYTRSSVLQLFLSGTPHTVLAPGSQGTEYKSFWFHVREYMDKVQRGFGFDATRMHHELRRITGGAIDLVEVNGKQYYNLIFTDKTIQPEEKVI